MTNLTLPIGDALTSVHYELLSWEQAPSADSCVDQVAMAVTLNWQESRPTRISWSTDPQREGLVQGGPSAEGPGPQLEIADVSERWGGLLGQRLTACTFSHALPPGDLPWAMNLLFASGAHLVIALGELLEGEPRYIPDSLLVTESRDAAVAFSPPAALGTAWSDRGD